MPKKILSYSIFIKSYQRLSLPLKVIFFSRNRSQDNLGLVSLEMLKQHLDETETELQGLKVELSLLALGSPRRSIEPEDRFVDVMRVSALNFVKIRRSSHHSPLRISLTSTAIFRRCCKNFGRSQKPVEHKYHPI